MADIEDKYKKKTPLFPRAFVFLIYRVIKT